MPTHRSTAGDLVTFRRDAGFNLCAGCDVGAPVLTALTGRLPRKPVTGCADGSVYGGNLLAGAGYMTLIVARLLTGLAHGGILLDWFYHRDKVWCCKEKLPPLPLCLVA